MNNNYSNIENNNNNQDFKSINDISQEDPIITEHYRLHQNELAKKLGEYLLKGYCMLFDTCQICNCILLRTPDHQLFCVDCHEIVIENKEIVITNKKKDDIKHSIKRNEYINNYNRLENKLKWAVNELIKTQNPNRINEMCKIITKLAQTIKTLKTQEITYIKIMVRKVAKHVARNKKKYWRKISTKDIEDQLEDVRVQEMTGGRRSEQPDHVLYHIDNERPLGSQSPSTEDMESSSIILRSIPKQRRSLDLNNLNSYKLLQPHSSVPPPSIDSRQPKDPSSKSTKRLIESQKIIETRQATKKKYQTALKQRSEAFKKNALDKVEKLELDDPHVSQSYDLWNTQNKKKQKVQSFIGPELASYLDQVHQTYDWKVPNHIIKKPSKLPAIDKPLPGTSYNPSYDDHQNLLRKAVDVELEKERKELKLQKNLPTLLTQNAAEPIKQSWLKEMSSGLFDNNIEHEQISETNPLSSVSVGKPVKVETKTVQQRNKEKLHKKKQALAKATKEKRIQDNKLFRIKSIRKEINTEDVKHKQRQEKRKIDYENREKYGTKKFGRYKFEEADLELNLSDEITGNLRTMKTEGNLLHDRFKSLQKRNIIETRIRAKPTKTKMKKYEKRSVREVGENYRPK
ncbi:unnamed protein product [Rotaria sp. Silwood1]|nr:unnamed protein product [Rotaria sp. Silwood1]CAF4804928.1 unnamed protein product [Rotaria sp. Silwood1]